MSSKITLVEIDVSKLTEIDGRTFLVVEPESMMAKLGKMNGRFRGGVMLGLLAAAEKLEHTTAKAADKLEKYEAK
jgi:hypothetical protein